ncbi:MAG: histidinol-phosphate transaminase [Clostridia bacterium]|nr:histidinol-phosphate transaminase [Clostridia bacterium]
MSKYWSELAKKIEPYVPGEQPKDRKYIKLNTNENPYPPSPRVIDAINRLANESLRLYPDPNCDDLRDTIALYHRLHRSQVFVGNGSDEVLAFAFMAFFDPDKTILFPDITYSFYPVYAELFNLKHRTVPLSDDFDIIAGDYAGENGGIIIANPNAPTAKQIDKEAIIKIIESNLNSVVIIDEAYVDFGGESVIQLINDYPNLLVVQTLSKSRSLAGMRLGFALGHQDLIQALDRIKNSFNSYTLDRLAIGAAVEAFKDEEYFRETCLKVVNTRERISGVLKEMGFKLTDSKANFIFASHPKIKARDLFSGLREKGILVRYFNKPRIDNYLRITIGTDEEMDCMVEALKLLLESNLGDSAK